jgi:putative nucleotidyltransferase with HDIG domain
MQGLALYLISALLILALGAGCFFAGRSLRIRKFRSEYRLGPLSPAAPVGPVLVGKKEPEDEPDLAAQNDALRQSISDLERSYDTTLETLGTALDYKAAETEYHSRRVTAYSILLARVLGFSREEIKPLARGAFLHDIGKICIPDAILRKPGVLTPQETELMKIHCLKGYQMLRRVSFLQDAAEIAYSHHERFDGSGYPRGLRGKDIPLGARIFAIVDTFEAITTAHTYRPARTIAEACAEIKLGSGTLFDPEITLVFLCVGASMWRELRNEIDDPTPPDIPAA